MIIPLLNENGLSEMWNVTQQAFDFESSSSKSQLQNWPMAASAWRVFLKKYENCAVMIEQVKMHYEPVRNWWYDLENKVGWQMQKM